MDRRQFLTAVGGAGTAVVAGCQGNDTRPSVRVRSDGFERLAGGKYKSMTIRGLNIGMAKPGSFPGSAAITQSEYDRWISEIGAIANVVRTYTIHPPAFYHALAAYNSNTTDPLYLLQGTWVPEEPMIKSGDVTQISGTVDQALQRTIDVVHGATTLPERPGHASGNYDADVHNWLLGYLFGVEWPPSVVEATNQAHSGSSYTGTYLESTGSPFEQWLAKRLDKGVAHETTTYGSQSPVGFVNWVTTDPLNHPYEPLKSEDAVSVDPDAVTTTNKFIPGTFAAYHIYPYYPDMLSETPKYVNYTNYRGKPDSYAGYLHDLVGATTHPLLVAEFGVPSSRGIAHRNVDGRNQGRLTEQQQGEMVAAMYEDIVHAGTAGGIAFAWQNEWFKRTWNLEARSVPGRRPYWSNIETPEQRFGMLAFEPKNAISLSGNSSEWTSATVQKPTKTSGIASERQLEELRITHSFEGLELRVQLREMSKPVAWNDVNVLLTIGLRGKSTALPLNTGATAVADFVVRLAGDSNSRLLVESSYDAFARQFGTAAGLPIAEYQQGTAGFVPVRETINRGYTVPPTGEKVPFQSVETGQLTYGNGNPSANTYNSLTDVHVSSVDRTIEVRLPWILLNIADPSTKQRIASNWGDGLSKVSFDTITVGAATYRPDADGKAHAISGKSNLTHAIPGQKNGELNTVEYGWETWSDVAYTERLKKSYHILKDKWT